MTATSAGTVTLAGGNNITLSTAASAITISGPNTHAQQTAISGINDGANTVTSGTVSLVGNNLTWSLNGQTLSASVAASHAVQTGISGISASDTLYTSGSVRFTGSNMVTVKSGTGQLVVLDATQTAQSAIKAFGASNTGNTAGNTGVSTGVDWVLAGSNSITISESTGAGGPNTLWLQMTQAAQTNQTGGIYVTAQSTGASSSSTYDLRTLSITPDGIISAGWSGGSFRISAPAQTALTATTVSSVSSANAVGANNSRFAMEAHIHEGVRRLGISNVGNTAGSTGAMPGSNIVLVGNNEVTLSGSTDAQSNVTISIVPAPAHSLWRNGPGGTAAAVSGNNSIVSVFPIRLDHPVDMSGLRMGVSISADSAANNSSAYIDQSYSFVLYTKNASTLSSLNSASTTYTVSYSSNGTINAAAAHQIEGSWASSTRLSQGEYWIAVHKSTGNSATGGANTTALGQSVSMIVGVNALSGAFQMPAMGAASDGAHVASLFMGAMSTGATMGTIQSANVAGGDTRGPAALLWVELRNYSMY